MQRRSLLAPSALIAAALAVPIISEKRQLPVVEGLVPIVGGLPVVVGIIGGSDGGLGGVGGLAGGKQATANDLPAAAPEIENKDLAKRKEVIGVPDLNTDLGSLNALGGLSGISGITPRTGSI